MKPAISADRVAYPDVSYQISDLVSQQPAEAGQVRSVKAKTTGVEDARSLRKARLASFETLLRRGDESMSPFGQVPRPAHWNNAPTVFHEPGTRELLRSAGVALKLNKKLDEMLNQVAGQITDPKFTAENVQSLLPRDFKGLNFKPEGNQDPIGFIQSRSMHTVDDLRSRLANRGSGVQENSDRASALLQLRSKLTQLGRLGNLIDRSFSDLEAVDLGRLKTPQLC